MTYLSNSVCFGFFGCKGQKTPKTTQNLPIVEMVTKAIPSVLIPSVLLRKRAKQTDGMGINPPFLSSGICPFWIYTKTNGNRRKQTEIDGISIQPLNQEKH